MKTSPESIPLLITSSVLPDDTTVMLNNPSERLFYTQQAIKEWIRISPASPIVICDGSNFDFGPLFQTIDKPLTYECLFFENDKKRVSQFGKGFGEGEIIRFALRNSQLLQKYEVFSKCTAKFWIKNFLELLGLYAGPFMAAGMFKSVFSLRATQYTAVDTRFYLVDKEFYEKELLNAHHDIAKRPALGIEYEFRDRLEAIKLNGYLFPSYIQIYGVSGASGKVVTSKFYKSAKFDISKKIIQLRKDYIRLFKHDT